jgi:hypothetical protein
LEFWSVLTFVYGRLHGEREERLREKRKMFPHYIITGPPQREEVLREILIIIFRRGVFYKFH